MRGDLAAELKQAHTETEAEKRAVAATAHAEVWEAQADWAHALTDQADAQQGELDRLRQAEAEGKARGERPDGGRGAPPLRALGPSPPPRRIQRHTG